MALLTLSQKFPRIHDLELNSKISSLFLVWGTMSNLNLPVVQTSQIVGLDCSCSLFYALLAFGAADSNQFDDCLKLLNKSWLLTLKSNSDPLAVIQSLTIISHIYLLNYQTLKRHNVDSQNELVPIEIIMDCLDQTALRILELNHEPLFNYWNIFHILSSFVLTYNKKPPAVHRLFLSKSLPNRDSTLFDALDQLTRLPVLPHDDEMCANCLIMGLSNELQTLKFNHVCSFKSKAFLHNAIIMANRSFIQQSNAISSSADADDTDTLNNLILISKRNILLNCPLRFQDLIVDYIVVPKSHHHWNLLKITLKEFIFEYNSTNLQQLLQAGSSEDITTACLNYTDALNISTINNNLGLISHPLLFIGFISNSNLKSDFDSLLNLPKGFTLSIIENYMCLIKIFVTMNRHPDFMTNPVFQSIVYLISEMGSASSQNLQLEISSLLQGSTSSISEEFIAYFTKNLYQNLVSWISSSYSGVNKLEIIEGIQGMMSQFTNSHSGSPIQSGSSSPGSRYMCQSTSISSISSTVSSYLPMQHSLSSSSLSQSTFISSSATSNVRQSLESGRITLPPINLSMNSAPTLMNGPGERSMILPMPYNHQSSGYRYSY